MNRRALGSLGLGLLGLLALACNEDDSEQMLTDDAALGDAARPDEGPTEFDCAPERSAWSEVEPLFQSACGMCHGETPQFGAPFTLTDFDALMKVDEAGRRVDRAVARLREGTMPPGGQPPLPAVGRAALIDWATCGEGMDEPEPGPNPGGFDVDRPVLDDPGTVPAGADFFELRADAFPVGPTQVDHYECFSFEVPVQTERFIKRIEVVVDDARVLHHAVLMPGGNGLAHGEHGPCTNGAALDLLYAWAPGQGALHLEEGGLRVRPGDRMTLQIHYNNGGAHPDVRDSSGVRIYHVEPEGPEVAMVTFGPIGFSVPPQSTGEVRGRCELPTDTKLIASFPHMHETGVAFHSTVYRGDGTEEPLINLTGWDFNSQFIYQTPMELKAGDVVETRCVFRNATDDTLRFGGRTQDEMCFNFAYVTPPLPQGYCNGDVGEEVEDFDYAPGICSPAGAEAFEPKLVEAGIVEGEPPVLAGGPPLDGLWRVRAATFYAESFEVGGAALDPERSRIDTFGFVGIEQGVARIDLPSWMVLATSIGDFERGAPISFGGAVDLDPANPGRVLYENDCGGVPVGEVRYQNQGEAPRISADLTLGPLQLVAVLELERP